MREAGRKIGVNVEIKIVEMAVYGASIFGEGIDMHTSGIYATINDPVPWMSLCYKSGGWFNELIPAGNAEVDALIEEFILSDPSDTAGRIATVGW